jgi:hypothetical protein
MYLKSAVLRFSISFFLFALSFSFACSTASWLPEFLKKSPPHKARMKELVDKEVVVIDKLEYVKVVNPAASEGTSQPRYLYIPVDEYLARKGIFTTATSREEEARKNIAGGSGDGVFSVGQEMQIMPATEGSGSVLKNSVLKNKVLVAYFDDRTPDADATVGDWMAQQLMKEIDRRSQKILFIDFQMVSEFLDARGIRRSEFEAPETLRLLNEVFGIKAVVVGQLSGPYAFTTKGGSGGETSSAIIKVDASMMDALTGKTLKTLSASNPILSSRERGSFSEEKAKLKAIDFTIADLGGQVSRELDGLDWSCRVVKVEGEELYLNAGKLTGLRVGDRLEVISPGDGEGRKEPRAEIQVSGFLGTDASIARSTNGRHPEVNDLLKMARREGP